MKLNHLTIHNIASIEHAEIDFCSQPLNNCDVFLITGNTGSGKSTILDAICLALYATTPRMFRNLSGKWNDNGMNEVAITDTKQLMRRQTQEAYVLLKFHGNDDNDYLAEWRVTKKKKNIDRCWKLSNLTHHEQSPDEGNGTGMGKDKAIIDVIENTAVGLNFEQFCRTTMLAQGEFTRFLNSNDKEKAEILEKVTGTDIYSKIGSTIYKINEQCKKRLEQIRDKKQNLKLLSDDEIRNLNDEKSQIEQEVKQQQDQQKAQLAKKSWLEKYDELNRAVNDAQTQYEDAKNVVDSKDFQDKRWLIEQWDNTNDARNWLSDQKKASKSIQEQNSELEKYNNSYCQLLNGQHFLKEEVKKLSIDLEKLNIEQLQKDKVHQYNQIQDLKQQIEAANKELEALELAKLREEQEKDNKHIANIAIAFEKLRALANAKQQYNDKKQQLDSTKSDIDKMFEDLKKKKPIVKEAHDEANKRSEDYNKLKDTINNFAKTLRANLHLGDTCPICAQKIKQAIPTDTYWQELVDNADKVYQTAKKKFETLYDEYNALNENYKSTKKNYVRDTENFNNDQSVQNAEQEFVNFYNQCQFTPPLQMPLQIQNIETDLKAYKTIIEKRIGARKNQISSGEEKENALKNLQNSRENLQSLFDKIQKQIEAASTIQNSINSKNKEINFNDDVISKIVKLMPTWQDDMANTAYQINDLQNNLTNLLANVNSAISQISNSQQIIKNCDEAISNFLANHPELTKIQLEQLSQLQLNDIIQQRKDIETQQMALNNKQTLLTNASTSLDNHQKVKPALNDGDNLSTISQSLQDLSNKMTELNTRVGEIRHQIKSDEEIKQTLEGLIQKEEAANSEYLSWNRLNTLIGNADGTVFRRIAQGYIFANLVQSANVYMQRLTNRYSLRSVLGSERVPSFIILVEDAYQGYVSRPVSTISGGESFLVSLALALALSDLSQSLRVETLFIDEGFGTLSGEPLQKAIETLHSLRTHTGRQVGIISHIEDVRERIAVQIQLCQENNNSSSTIKIVP